MNVKPTIYSITVLKTKINSTLQIRLLEIAEKWAQVTCYCQVDLNPVEQQQHHSIERALKRISEVRASVLDRFTLSTRCDDADEACTFLPRGFPLARRKGVNVEAAARVRVEPRTAVFNNFSVMMVEVPTKRNNFYESGILSYWIYFRSVRWIKR